jgi:endonuclease III
MVVERGDATGAWYWKGLPTRTLAFVRQKCAPRHKSSKECLMDMCCGNASGSHKLKRTLIRKAKKA